MTDRLGYTMHVINEARKQGKSLKSLELSDYATLHKLYYRTLNQDIKASAVLSESTRSTGVLSD